MPLPRQLRPKREARRRNRRTRRRTRVRLAGPPRVWRAHECAHASPEAATAEPGVECAGHAASAPAAIKHCLPAVAPVSSVLAQAATALYQPTTRRARTGVPLCQLPDPPSTPCCASRLKPTLLPPGQAGREQNHLPGQVLCRSLPKAGSIAGASKHHDSRPPRRGDRPPQRGSSDPGLEGRESRPSRWPRTRPSPGSPCCCSPMAAASSPSCRRSRP